MSGIVHFQSAVDNYDYCFDGSHQMVGWGRSPTIEKSLNHNANWSDFVVQNTFMTNERLKNLIQE